MPYFSSTPTTVQCIKRPANVLNAAAEQLVFRGERGAKSESEYAEVSATLSLRQRNLYRPSSTQWNRSFVKRESNLDWEDDIEGRMGTSAVKLLRFIEASEFGDRLNFVSATEDIWDTF